MSLWAEYLGVVDDLFTHPESVECVSEMRGHLQKYLVGVDPSGEVRSLPEYENFPDVGSQIVQQNRH
ncbi:putative phospholipase D [Helianthus annuus]|nr:putative phospholipase D [Helianthus annuus]KAJ0499730.1 putative phospholipase D [Helianthus annuus]KAJ0665807.1 putative phospholipase D [Helianthus annuus]KAJ0851576.1 putative phospholipase D [Helianthus annuus]